jgi:hypothetical protein
LQDYRPGSVITAVIRRRTSTAFVLPILRVELKEKQNHHEYENAVHDLADGVHGIRGDRGNGS